MRSADDDLRAHFDALRRSDTASAPDLEMLVAKRRVRRPSRLVLPSALASAAAIVLVAGLRFTASGEPTDISVSPSEPSILAWQSPTASLLQTPGRELLATVPALRSSLLPDIP